MSITLLVPVPMASQAFHMPKPLKPYTLKCENFHVSIILSKAVSETCISNLNYFQLQMAL